MQDKMNVRKRWIKFRVNDKEFEVINDFSKTTSCHGISEYARNVLLKKPVIVKHRNESAAEILAVMIRLKNELNAIGNNFNQLVRELHRMDHDFEIIAWLQIGEMSLQTFMNKVEEIRQLMNQIYLTWSQK